MECDHLISLRLPAHTREALDWIAADLEISRSELIRDLVGEFLGGTYAPVPRAGKRHYRGLSLFRWSRAMSTDPARRR
jgi:metal-responsive CopG/Arc/MetJ family transcriptional regulator